MIKVLLASILIPLGAWSFESNLNYSFLDESQKESLDGPGFIDSEYSSDILTYLPFLESDYRYSTSNKALNISVGSISSKEFFKQQDLKLQFKMNQALEFGYYDFSYSDFEDQHNNSIVEFQYMPNDLGISIFGGIEHNKSKDDFGFSVNWKSIPDHRVKLFHQWSDFDKNTRNRNDDFFLKKPMSYGITGLLINGKKEFLQYEFKRDEESKWSFPSEPNVYSHSKTTVSIKGISQYNNKELSYRLYLDSKDKSNTTDGEAQRGRVLSVLRSKYLDQKIFGQIPQLGLAYQKRKWKINGSVIETEDIQPHFVLWGVKKAHKENFYWWQTGYEASFHQSRGDSTLMSQSQLKSWAVEHRANLWWNYEFLKKGVLSFVFTFDLDQLGSPEAWEGGAGQISISF